MAATWKKLAYADDVPALTLFANAHYMLASNAANVAVGLEVAANSLVGRLAGNIQSIDAANLRTLANVEDGADVTDATNVGAAGAIMKTVLAAKGDLIWGSAANTASNLAVGNVGQVLTVAANSVVGWDDAPGGSAFPTTANAATRANLAPAAIGEGCFQVDTLEAYVCTVL